MPSLSIFTTGSYMSERGDHYIESLNSYKELADQTVLILGDKLVDLKFEPFALGIDFMVHNWPKEFDWPFIGEQFQRGYDACSSDWVIHADLDYIFHESDFGKIRQALRDYPSSPGISFYKWQFVQPDRYNLKARLVIAVNKGAYGDRIKFNGGGDLCQPTLDGRLLDLAEIPQAGVPFYNYEKLTKRVEQVADDVGRMDRAYFKHFGKYLYGEGDDQSAFDGWMKMMLGRYDRPSEKIPLNKHPKYIQETIKNLKPDQFGHSAFGYLRENNYV